MIKSCIIILIFVTGCLCRVLPAEVSEERTVTISGDEESKAADLENTQVLSKEVRSEEEKTANPKKTDELEEGKTGDLDEKVIKTRSTEEGKAADLESNDESVIKTRTDEADKSANSENSEISTRTAASDSNSDDLKSNLRKREENSFGTQVRSDEQEDASTQLKLGTLQTETSDKDDASHIHNTEQKQASHDDNIEEEIEPIQRNDNKVKSRSASEESDSKTVSDGESKSVNEDLQEKAANPEDDSRSSLHDDQDNAKSATEEEDEGLLRSDKDLVQPVLSRRMLDQDLSVGDDKVERSDSYAVADTRMAAREDKSASGHQVHSYYFGGSLASQSQYPYTPLENPTPEPFFPLPFSNELRSVSSIHPASQKSGNPFISAQNFLENNQNFKPFLPFPNLKSNELFRPLPPLESNGQFRPLLPLESNGQFRPLPPLESNGQFRPLLPLESNGQFRPLPPLESNGQFRPLPPLESGGLFRPLPPLESNGQFRPLPPLESNGQFRPLPPLESNGHFRPLPPLESNGQFRPLPPLESNRQFRLPLLNHQLQPSPSYQEQTPTWKPECFNCNNVPFQNLQPQQFQRFQRPPLPQNFMSTLQPLNPAQNTFSMLRQALPESSQESASVFSRNWRSSSRENPFAVSTSVKQSSFAFS